MKRILILLAVTLAIPGFSQDENLRNYDYVYLPHIKSVKFHITGLFTTIPIMQLGNMEALQLSFDDMDGDFKSYTYSVVHCNADWTPSGLFETEYMNGFSEGDIEQYEYSFKTKSIYTHYQLLFPNDEINVTKSGNYLLKVYEDEDYKRLVITRRFMVADPIVSIFPDVVRPSRVSKMDTHQEIDFRVGHKGFEIRNPRTELAATILQNGRWDNAVTGVPPKFTRLEEQIFDHQDLVVFPAGREFRGADLRSMERLLNGVGSIDYSGEEYDVHLLTDKKRIGESHLEIGDINGNFIIETLDDMEHDLMSHYVNVLFSLYTPVPIHDTDVYVFGGITDWQLKPEFKMVFNPATSTYVTKAKLKQGFYNYLYATLPKGADRPEFEETEGNRFQTNNNYTILIYYRPFGGRYDQLIGAESFTSRL